MPLTGTSGAGREQAARHQGPTLTGAGGRRDRKASASSSDRNTQGRISRQATGPTGLEHPGGSGQKPSKDEASSPGLERPGLHKKEEAARTSSEGKQDQAQGTGPRQWERRRRPRQERQGTITGQEGDIRQFTKEKKQQMNQQPGRESRNARQGLGQPGPKDKQP